MNLPEQYKWLNNLTLPWTIMEALKELGTTEVAGVGNNDKILSWADEMGGWEASWYNRDSIPWCGLFAAVICKRAKKDVKKKWLAALEWKNFGMEVDVAGLGDILVFKRKGGGHVGFYIAEDETHYHVLGGNQSDAVNIKRIKKSRMYSINRPLYNNKPGSVRPFHIGSTGDESTNEA